MQILKLVRKAVFERTRRQEFSPLSPPFDEMYWVSASGDDKCRALSKGKPRHCKPTAQLRGVADLIRIFVEKLVGGEQDGVIATKACKGRAIKATAKIAAGALDN